MRVAVVISILALIAVIAACSSDNGNGVRGQPCKTAGSTGECGDGFVCGKPSATSGDLECLPVCTDDRGCAPTEECAGVTGTTIKGCRLR